MTAEANQEAADPNPDPYTRLHITPLDADLLGVVLSSSIRPRARNVSYHTLEAFPERRYGFVELPASDADKIKQKLNGAVLKGVKIRIEQARPEIRPVPLGDAAMAGEKAPKRERKPRDSDKLRKRKREGEEIPGVELEPGRKVKRGWTVPADESRTRKVKEKREKRDKSDKSGKDKDKARKERREVKSKYTEHAECLVKSSVPNTTAAPAANDGDDGEAEGKKKRKKSKTKEVVIHEFEKTTKFPTFLKTAGSSSSARKPNLEFVDGKGWVDEEGTVVEAVKTRSTITIASGTPAAISSDSKPSSDESEDEAPKEKDTAENSVQPTETSTPSVREKSKPTEPIPAPPSFPTPDHPRPESSSSAKSLTIKIPPTTPTVHPLEALYKRPKQQQQQQDANGSPAPAQQAEAEPFSFFGHADGSDEEMGEREEEDGEGATLQMPMTPFTRQDFESRGVRSAAPTPDTAHMNRRFRLWPRGEAGEGIEEGDEDEKEEDDDEADEDDDSRSVDGPSGATAAAGSKGQEATATGDFQEWFWNNRGDLNRSWKRRRKLVGKDKRYQENRARAERAI